MLLDQSRKRLGRLRALAAPVLKAFVVQLEGYRLDVGVERTDALDETPVATIAAIGDHDSVKGALLAAVPSQTNLYGHSVSSMMKRLESLGARDASTSYVLRQVGGQV